MSVYEDGVIEEFAKDIRDIVDLEEMQWVFDRKGQFAESKLDSLLGVNIVEEAITILSDDQIFKQIFQIQ